MWPTAFTSKNLKCAQQHYSNINCEALGILHRLEKFHHYYFVREVSVITDHKPLVTILTKDVAMLLVITLHSLWIHQYRVHITYKPDPDLYTADWLSCNNHKENKDQRIEGMRVTTKAISTLINIPVCTSIHDTQTDTHEHTHLQKLKMYIIDGWSHRRGEVTEA